MMYCVHVNDQIQIVIRTDRRSDKGDIKGCPCGVHDVGVRDLECP